MREAVIVSAVRTPAGKAPKGALRQIRPDELAALVIRESIARVPGLEPGNIDDVIMGCAFPEGEQGMNVARVAALRAGLPVSVPAQTVNRFCASGLQTIAAAAQNIMCGGADVVVAGGVESMSLIPMGGKGLSPNPVLMETRPGTYLSMGLTAERVAEKYGISREDQDEFAAGSHRKAAAAIGEGRFKDEIVPVTVRREQIRHDHRVEVEEFVLDTDEGVRADTSREVLAKLRPVFHARGTVTAGNSSQMSDGAAAVVVMSREVAEGLGVRPLAAFRAFAVGGVDPEIMGIGPVAAVPKALEQVGLSLEDVGLIELNEAFASQALAVIRELGLDPDRVNPNGGAIALGHPLGCTGAKLTATLLHELARRKVRYGMVTMCIGGGMGAAGIFENIA